MERWVCPSDRHLALRAKLGTGWSIRTHNPLTVTKRKDQLSAEEHETILRVIERAEILERLEMERVGKLVDKMEKVVKSSIGNGTTQCILCGEEFGILLATSPYCDYCKKAVCSKCGVVASSSQRQSLWLCKLCSEKRELWKKSGAWFFKGLPQYTLPPAAKKNTLNGQISTAQLKSKLHNDVTKENEIKDETFSGSSDDSGDEN